MELKTNNKHSTIHRYTAWSTTPGFENSPQRPDQQWRLPSISHNKNTVSLWNSDYFSSCNPTHWYLCVHTQRRDEYLSVRVCDCACANDDSDSDLINHIYSSSSDSSLCHAHYLSRANVRTTTRTGVHSRCCENYTKLTLYEQTLHQSEFTFN